MFFNWITVLGFNFILNVHQSQIPKTFEPSYDTKRWITEEFGERYNYEQELKIFINHYRAGGTINQIGNTLSDLGYCVQEIPINTTQTTKDTQERRERINNVFAISNQTKQSR